MLLAPFLTALLRRVLGWSNLAALGLTLVICLGLGALAVWLTGGIGGDLRTTVLAFITAATIVYRALQGVMDNIAGKPA